MTVIKSTNGNEFGGYVEKAWSSNDEAISDSAAFIFSKDNEAFKAKCSTAEAINCHLSFDNHKTIDIEVFAITN